MILKLMRVPCEKPEHENLRIKIEKGTKIQCLGCKGVWFVPAAKSKLSYKTSFLAEQVSLLQELDAASLSALASPIQSWEWSPTPPLPPPAASEF